MVSDNSPVIDFKITPSIIFHMAIVMLSPIAFFSLFPDPPADPFINVGIIFLGIGVLNFLVSFIPLAPVYTIQRNQQTLKDEYTFLGREPIRLLRVFAIGFILLGIYSILKGILIDIEGWIIIVISIILSIIGFLSLKADEKSNGLKILYYVPFTILYTGSGISLIMFIKDNVNPVLGYVLLGVGLMSMFAIFIIGSVKMALKLENKNK
ncbi:MAG: hypothetical protein INQ03_25145 [Candidatus Heimdallarchaeota archaeon]|nr:hypothetical protein [Candidatus Heimdallarchaeota archaeon]